MSAIATKVNVDNLYASKTNFDIDKCNNRFDNFKKLHDLEVERLTGQRNLSSIAI